MTINHGGTSPPLQARSPEARQLSSFDEFIIPLDRLWKPLASQYNKSKALILRSPVYTGELSECVDKWHSSGSREIYTPPCVESTTQGLLALCSRNALLFTELSFPPPRNLTSKGSLRELRTRIDFALGPNWKRTLRLLCFSRGI